jgi:hypothetical protein
MKIFVVTEIDPDYMDSHAYTNKTKAAAKVKEFEESGVEFEENEVDLGSNEYLLVYGEEGEFTVEAIAKQNVKSFLDRTSNKYGAILDMKKGYARCYSGSALETENAIAEFEDGDVTESVKSLKHVRLFEQFINEDKFRTALGDLDKWMPDDEELQDEYYVLTGSGDVEGLMSFFDEYADTDKLQQYGIKYSDLKKLAKTAIDL